MICCTCQMSIDQSWSDMIWTLQEPMRHTNDNQCPNCRTVPISQILCCKCGKGVRLNHYRSTCGDCDATSQMHSPEPQRERTFERRFTITESLQSTGNDDQEEFRLTASTPPASNEDIDTRTISEPTNYQLF